MTSLNHLYIQSELDVDSSLDLVVHYLPEVARKEIELDKQRQQVQTSSMRIMATPIEEFTDEIAQDYSDKLGFAPSLVFLVEEYHVDSDLYLADSVIQLVANTDWNIGLEFWQTLYLIRHKSELFLNQAVVNEGLRPNLAERLGNREILYKLKEMADL